MALDRLSRGPLYQRFQPPSTGGSGSGIVSSVFGRTGDVIAFPGDYTAAQVTNAVSTLGSYSNPSWITSLDWSKITGVPSSLAQTPWASDIDGAVHNLNNVKAIGIGAAATNNLGITYTSSFAGTNAAIYAQNLSSVGGMEIDLINNSGNTIAFGLGGSTIASGASYFRSDTIFNLLITGAGTPRFTCHTNGFVGVNNQNPAYQLDVVGDINISTGSLFKINGVQHTHSAADITSGTIAMARLGSGTPSASTYLRGDGSWSSAVQTPWTSNIDGGNFSLSNALNINTTGAIFANQGISFGDFTNAICYVNHAGGTVNGIYGLYWDSSEKLTIYAGGSGRWYWSGAGHLLASVTNTYDIGTSATVNAPRSIYAGTSVICNGTITCGQNNGFVISARALMSSTASGNLKISDSGGSTFSMLQFGGVTSSFPAIKRNGVNLEFKLADDSGYIQTTANASVLTGTRPTLMYDQGSLARARLYQGAAAHQVQLATNSYFDGTNYQRDDTGNSSSMIALFGGNSGAPNSLKFYWTASGTGAITWVSPFAFDLAGNVETISGTRPTLLFDQGTTARSRIAQWLTGATIYVSNNAFFDGAAWQRDNTAASSTHVALSSSSLSLNYVAAGSGAITWVSPFTFDMVNNCFYHMLPGAANDATFLPANSMIYYYLNEAGNTLVFRVKYSTGTIKGGTIALS